MPKNKLYIFLIMGSILLFGNYSFAIEELDEQELFKAVEIKSGAVLTLKDCLAAAFRNSPNIKRKKYELDLAQANVGIAKSQYFPVIGAGVGFYNSNNSNKKDYYSHYREFPSVAASVNQLVWNFGKTTAYIKMEEFYKIGAEYEFADSLCSALFDVKTKYYNVLYAKALVEIAEYNKQINEDFVKISEGRNKYELETALINLSDAQVQLIDAENTYKNAIIDLSNAMYLEDEPDYSVASTKTFSFDNVFFNSPKKLADEKFEPEPLGFDLSKAVEIAYENSPELKVLDSTKNAMEQSLKYIKKTYMPDLTADLGYGFNKTNYESSNNALRIGVNLSSSVNLMELKHGIKAAQTQINLAENEILLFKKDLFFEVKRALNNVDKAQRQIPLSQVYLDEGLENLDLIKEQYMDKNIDYTSLQDARKDYIQLLYNYADSIYSYNIALIQLEEAMHYHIADIHHKSGHAIQYHFKELLENLDSALDCDEKHMHDVKNKKHN